MIFFYPQNSNKTGKNTGYDYWEVATIIKNMSIKGKLILGFGFTLGGSLVNQQKMPKMATKL